jgi:hypothetical protein
VGRPALTPSMVFEKLSSNLQLWPWRLAPNPGRMEKSMSPKTLQEVERAIGALTPQEVQELYVWLEQHFPQPMDARLPSDLSAGRLDTAIQRALDDEKNGRLRPL